MPNSPQVTSVERALAILETLDSSPRGLNISEIGRKLGVPKSTAHVIILTLERLGYVVHESGSRSYRLGLKVYGLGRETMQNLRLPDVALPHMSWLSEMTRLTVHLAVLEKNQVIYIQKVDGLGLIRFDTFIGKRANIHCTALGKVLLAYSPEVLRREFFSKTTFARHTKHTITSRAALREALARIREQGYGVDDQEEELEVRCLAVPVFSQTGEPVAALSVAGTVGQIRPENMDQLVASLKQTADKICRSLGPIASV